VVFDPNVTPTTTSSTSAPAASTTCPWDSVQVRGLERLRGFDVDEYQVVMRGRSRPARPEEASAETANPSRASKTQAIDRKRSKPRRIQEAINKEPRHADHRRPVPPLLPPGLREPRRRQGVPAAHGDSHPGKWRVVFLWPMDFTFVCPTEIAAFGKRNAEFRERDAQVLGVSTDSQYVHLAWRATTPT
jgi:hypothetical protein